jgi:hypothetical protein
VKLGSCCHNRRKEEKMKDLHKLLTHIREDCVQQMAKFYGWEVVVKFDPQ